MPSCWRFREPWCPTSWQTTEPSLEHRLVIDATNQMGAPVANCRAALPGSVRYARAFNTLGGENMENPMFDDGPADRFFPHRKRTETSWKT